MKEKITVSHSHSRDADQHASISSASLLDKEGISGTEALHKVG